MDYLIYTEWRYTSRHDAPYLQVVAQPTTYLIYMTHRNEKDLLQRAITVPEVLQRSTWKHTYQKRPAEISSPREC